MKFYIVTFDTKRHNRECSWYIILEANNAKEARAIAEERWQNKFKVTKAPHMFHIESHPLRQNCDKSNNTVDVFKEW